MLNMSCAELMCERSCFFALIHEHHTHIDVHGRHGCVVVQLCTSPSVSSEDRLCPCSICARWSSSLLRRPSWSRIRFAGVRIAFARNCRTELGFCFALLVAARLLQSGRAGTPVTTFVGDADPDPHPVDIRMSISRHGPGLIAILPRPDAKQYRAPIRNCSRRCRRLWP
jgi:hypothetical protein